MISNESKGSHQITEMKIKHKAVRYMDEIFQLHVTVACIAYLSFPFPGREIKQANEKVRR